MMMDNETQKRDEAKEKIKRLLFEQDAVEKLRNFGRSDGYDGGLVSVQEY